MTEHVTLAVGDAAPDFTLPTDGGGSLSLADLGGKAVVLYFYPKDSTPGCTTEARAFRDRQAEIAALGAVVVGVSKDSVKKHDTFKAKEGLTFALASDAEGDVCERYGVWTLKKNYGREYMGIERSTFLIDGTGVIRAIWRKVKVAGHDAQVLDALRALAGAS